LGITDEEVWEYSTEIRKIISEKGLKHVETLRIADLLDLPNEDHSKATYVQSVPFYREVLFEEFGPRDWDVSAAIKTDKDILLTYRGYLKFLSKDLESSDVVFQSTNGSKKQMKKIIEVFARRMLVRGKVI
jgi:pyoverdine/dityrosine biosynthesis protein Dit1